SIACFRNDLDGTELLFAAPRDSIVDWEPDEFLPALERIETARNDGRGLSGYLAYEACYLLDPARVALMPQARRVPLLGFGALVASLPQGRRAPLLCFGVFDAPADQTMLADLKIGEPTNASLAAPRATWSEAKYTERFARLHRHLREGDAYQANLTFPVEAS